MRGIFELVILSLGRSELVQWGKIISSDLSRWDRNGTTTQFMETD